MSTPTDRLGLNTYSEGEDPPWTHTDTAEALDELAIERGPIADRPNEGDHDDELYLATDPDERTLYRWDESGSQWVDEFVVPENIDAGDLGFDPATQSELDSHEADADAHHTKYTDEEVRDVVGAALAAGDKLSWTVDDAGDTITIDTTALDQEEVEDVVAALITTDSNLTFNYDDGAGTITIGLAENVNITELSTERVVLEDTGGA